MLKHDPRKRLESSWKGRPGALQIVGTLVDILELNVVFNPSEYSVLLSISQFPNPAPFPKILMAT